MAATRIRILSIVSALVILPAGVMGQARVGFPRTWSPGYQTASPGPLTTGGVTPTMRTTFPSNVGHRGGLNYGGSHSGVHISASSDGDVSFGLHVGSDLGLLHAPTRPVIDYRSHSIRHDDRRHDKHRNVVYRPVYYPYYGWWYPYYGYRYRGPAYYQSYYSSIDGAYYNVASTAYNQPQAQAAAPQEPVDPPTDAELGAYSLRYGDADDAVDSYRKFLRENPDDAKIMREMAIALLSDIRYEEGVAMLAMAYRTDETLADEPIDLYLFEDAAALRSLLQKCVIHANRTKLGSAWLTVAVLMQAEDRDDRARKMIERARDAGLDTSVADSMKRALGG